ncbi:MAG: hypothetical protein Q7Q73_03965 [Verrucomicrobiota bacterium JB024]|nr:hypothetical protein [Verrucomicrobiota bacterium JB024]
MFKHTRTPFFLSLLVALLACPNVGRAQSAEAPPLNFTYQIYYLSGSGGQALSKQEMMAGKRYQADPPPELYTEVDGEATRLSIQPNTASPTYHYRGQSPFSLYKQEIVEGETRYAPVVSLPESMRLPNRVLLMLLGSQQSGYKLVPLDVSAKNLGQGQLLIMNMSGNRLAARTGKQSIEIAPARSATIPMGELVNNRFKLSVAANESDNWKLIYNSFVIRGSEAPLLALIYPSENGTAGWKVKFVDSPLFE